MKEVELHNEESLGESSEEQQGAEKFWRSALVSRPAWITSDIPAALLSERHAQADALATEALALHRLLSDVNARRNALRSPIRLLPPEVLVMIFHHLADDTLNEHEEENVWYWPLFPEHNFHGGEPEFQRCYTERLGWILVTHVCRSWRDAALNHTSLWSKVRVDGVFPWQEFVRRARGSPLTVSIENSTRVLDYQDCLRSCLRDIRELSLPIRSQAEMAALASTLASPAPRLSKLRVRPSRMGLGAQSQASHLSLSRDFFEVCAPALRHIDIRDALRIFPWYMAPRNLRVLEISDEKHCTTTSELLLVLEHLENLETLSFFPQYSLANAANVHAPDGRSVRLSRLRNLTVSAFGHIVVSLWRSILAPPTLCVNLTLKSCDDATSSTLRRLLEAYIQHPESPKFPSLRIGDTLPKLSLELDTRNTPFGNCARDSWCPPSHLTITVNLSRVIHMSGTFLSFVRIALSACPQIICIAYDYEWASTMALRDFFHPASNNVHTLEFHRSRMTLAPFMRALDQTIIETPSADIFLPSLKKIIISGLGISDDLNLHLLYSALHQQGTGIK